MKKLNFLKVSSLILNSMALIMIMIVAVALLFKLSMSIVFMSVVGITVGSYLILESKVKDFTSLIKKQSFKFRNILHSLSFGFGLVGVILSIVLLTIGRVESLDSLIGWFYVIMAVLSISEAVENLI